MFRSLFRVWNLRSEKATDHCRNCAPSRRKPLRRMLHLEQLEDRSLPAVLTVTTALDVIDAGDGLLSLREAILESNASVGVLDTIAFNIGGGGVQTISPLSALPPITDPVVLDGTTQPDFAGMPIIQLNGSSAIPVADEPVDGLYINDGGGSTVRGLVINRFRGDGIRLEYARCTIVGNYIGTNVTGNLDYGNLGVGVYVPGGEGLVIGGTAPGEGNVIWA